MAAKGRPRPRPKAGRSSKARPRKTGRSRAAAARRPRRAKKPRKTAARRRKPAPRRPAKTAARRPPRKRTAPARAAAPKPTPRPARPRTPPPPRAARSERPPQLNRERRLLSDEERLNAPRDLTDDHLLSAARAGHDELKSEMSLRTETSPVLTAGDVDAKWQDAYSVGDETPGGDNPTPDQDRVDDIGKALGINYRDDEELQGGDEVKERDRHRWELDPASSEDWPHDKDKE